MAPVRARNSRSLRQCPNLDTMTSTRRLRPCRSSCQFMAQASARDAKSRRSSSVLKALFPEAGNRVDNPRGFSAVDRQNVFGLYDSAFPQRLLAGKLLPERCVTG